MAIHSIKPKDDTYCGMCGVGKAQPKHQCPYDVSRGKGLHKCDCCERCEKGCEKLIERNLLIQKS